MKITFLGTAAIGYPLAFCNCENCQQARIYRGKSIRKRSSILINENLLIDLGPDTQTSMMMYNKDKRLHIYYKLIFMQTILIHLYYVLGCLIK